MHTPIISNNLNGIATLSAYPFGIDRATWLLHMIALICNYCQGILWNGRRKYRQLQSITTCQPLCSIYPSTEKPASRHGKVDALWSTENARNDLEIDWRTRKEQVTADSSCHRSYFRLQWKEPTLNWQWFWFSQFNSRGYNSPVQNTESNICKE